MWIGAAGLLLQAFWALQLTQPAYMDAYYYALNGQRLAGGAGFSEPIIWQFLDAPQSLPAPSHSYWMPLASILAAAGYTLGEGFRAAQLPFWLLAGLLPLLSYIICLRLGGARWQAIMAALLTASGGFYARAWNQPETFAPFAWAGALCLLALAQATTTGNQRAWLLAGLAAGLAYLTRADGILLLLVALWYPVSSKQYSVSSSRFTFHVSRFLNYRPLLTAYGLLGTGFLAITAGWFIRNWFVFGRPLPAAGLQTIFLTNYDDLYAYGRTFTLSTYLQWGWNNILSSKMDAIWLALQSFVAVNGLIFLTPLVLVGWIVVHRRRPAFLGPLTGYTLLLYVTMTLVFTFPGARGGLFHSSVALWPWLMALAPIGLSSMVDWIAARRASWQPEVAKPFFAGSFVFLAVLLTLAINLIRPSQTGEDALTYGDIARQLPPNAVIMVGDAPAFSYHTGLPAVSVPNEPPHTLLEAAAHYGVTHLVLDQDHPRPLGELYRAAMPPSPFHQLDSFTSTKLYAITPENGYARE